jgi:hypothetical protein
MITPVQTQGYSSVLSTAVGPRARLVHCGVLRATVARLDLLENVMFICAPFTGLTISKAMATKTLDTQNVRNGHTDINRTSGDRGKEGGYGSPHS